MKIIKNLLIFALLITSPIIMSRGTDPTIRSMQLFGSDSAKFQESTSKIVGDINDGYREKVQNFHTDIEALRNQRKAALDDCEKYLMGEKMAEDPCHKGARIKPSLKVLNLLDGGGTKR